MVLLPDEFLNSQDLSNCTTEKNTMQDTILFLYSQDLSNCTTILVRGSRTGPFLYSQDLSNCTTESGFKSVP